MSEITLVNNDERTAVCCLSSLNLEKYDEWKDSTLVQDLITFLDNSIQWFIDWAGEDLKRPAYSAEKERAVGLGGMGWANLLMQKQIAFESEAALELNKQIWKLIKEKAVEQSKELAKQRGEPDDVKGSGMRASHLCVTGDTKILTRNGQVNIEDVVGKEVEVWNGTEWSTVVPFETGKSKVLEVTLSNGMSLKTTPEHKFLVATPLRDTKEESGLHLQTVEAKHLRIGDCMPKFRVSPSDDCHKTTEFPYESGLFCGDGSISNSIAGKYPRNELRLYGEKMKLKDIVKWKSSTTWGGEKCVRGYLPDNLLKKYQVPFGYTVEDKTLWLCGLIDTDGAKNSCGVSISMKDKSFAQDVALLVQELGGDVKITTSKRVGGYSGSGIYYIVNISKHSCNVIFKTIKPNRVKIHVEENNEPRIGGYQMHTVISVKELDGEHDTYCFTEPKMNRGVFNGVLTKQCAVAPNANSSILCNTSPSVEPLMSNAYTQKSRLGIVLNKNKYLNSVLAKYGLDNDATWRKIVKENGSVQWIDELTAEEKQVFKTAWEIDQHVIVQQAEDRQKYVCQSQSINLFFLPGTNRSYINSVHLKALYSDVLKSLYYFRTGSAVAVQNVKEDEQRVALQDWTEHKPTDNKEDDGECIACQA